MLKVFPRIVLTIIISFSLSSIALSQSLKKAESIILKIGENSLKGSAINTDFDREETFKAWWKYSKKFSRTQTLKNYLLHTIPAVEGESTDPVVFYSRVEKINDSSSKVSAALAKNGMTNDDLKKHEDQIAELLIDFRQDFYTNNLQKKISNTEKEAAKVSRNLDKQITQCYKLQQEFSKAEIESSDDQILSGLKEELRINQQNQDSISLQLAEIQQTIDSYKKTLGEIK